MIYKNTLEDSTYDYDTEYISFEKFHSVLLLNIAKERKENLLEIIKVILNKFTINISEENKNIYDAQANLVDQPKHTKTEISDSRIDDDNASDENYQTFNTNNINSTNAISSNNLKYLKLKRIINQGKKPLEVNKNIININSNIELNKESTTDNVSIGDKDSRMNSSSSPPLISLSSLIDSSLINVNTVGMIIEEKPQNINSVTYSNDNNMHYQILNHSVLEKLKYIFYQICPSGEMVSHSFNHFLNDMQLFDKHFTLWDVEIIFTKAKLKFADMYDDKNSTSKISVNFVIFYSIIIIVK